MTSSDSHVRFEGVNKAFGDHAILSDVSFEVPRASAYCLLGRSGAGKSVTLKLLVGLVAIDGGRILVGDDNIPELDSRELGRARSKIGFLFQNAALFDSLSLGENLAFPMRRHRDWTASEVRDHVQEKLEQVGLGDHHDKMPSALSGGMKKRAGLARALALDPDMLLVDEPSAGLDPITSAEIDELLLELKSNEGTTMVVVTHNIPSARRIGDTLAILDDAKLLAEGTAQELDQSELALVRELMSSEMGG